MIWRKNPAAGPEAYECIILDHQMWSYGGAPMYDLAVFFGCSCTTEQMEERLSLGLKMCAAAQPRVTSLCTLGSI